MLISVLVYLQVFAVTFLYCVCALPFLLAALLVHGFRKESCAGVIRFFIVWYGRCVLRAGLSPWIRVRFRDFAEGECFPAIFVCNHRSASDPFLAAVLKTCRPIAQGVNRWPMRLPFFGFFARLGGYLDATAHGYEELRNQAEALLRQNTPIVVFPEGTRSGNREMNQFHGLFFRIARDLNCPLIPVAIAGNEHIPDRNFRISTGRILVHKLPALDRKLTEEMNSYQLKRLVRRILQDETAKMDQELKNS